MMIWRTIEYDFYFAALHMNTINSNDTLPFKKFGFDGDKYLRLQREKILDRISNFSGGRLYLEI
ncbi:MAG: hypothetical protein WCJ39_00495 [bacterium]